MSPIINCDTVSKSYGSHVLFRDLSLGIFHGDKIGIIGPNGAGKSTFLKLLAKIEEPDEGVISFRRSLRVAYVPQYSSFRSQALDKILLDELDLDLGLSEHEKETRIQIILSKLGFSDFSQNAHHLSGGWKKRFELAKQLIKLPDVLLLDEPTNHLDLEGVLWLEKFLQDATFTFLIISHDRYFLQNVTNRMVEINHHFPNGIFAAAGHYADFLERREEFLSGQMQYEKSLRSKARREIEWLKQNPKARTTKAQSRVQEAGRIVKELAEVKGRNQVSKAQISFSSMDRETRKLLVATNLCKSYEQRKLFAHLNFTLSPGMCLGVVGPNGCGKSTLLKILTGDLLPDKGTIKCVDGLKIVHFDQHRAQLPLNISMRQALAPDGEHVHYLGKTIHVNGWCKRFLFTPNRLDLPLSQLSGGERARILIARLMVQPADVLLLDEPTNDLDIPTLEILEESLQEFPGAIVLITHDRYLLEQVSTGILGLGVPGDNHLFADYSQWLTYQSSQKNLLKESTVSSKEHKTEKPRQQVQQTSIPKLSYNEKREWEQIEGKIIQAEEDLKNLHLRVENPALAADRPQFEELCKQITVLETEIEKMYHRWDELNQKTQSNK